MSTVGALPGDCPLMGRPSGRSRVSPSSPPESQPGEVQQTRSAPRRFRLRPSLRQLLLPEAGAAGGRRQGSQGPPTALKPRLRVQQALLFRQPKISWVVGATSKNRGRHPGCCPRPRDLAGKSWGLRGAARQKYELAHRQQLHSLYEMRQLCAHCGGRPRQHAPTKRPLSAH